MRKKIKSTCTSVLFICVLGFMLVCLRIWITKDDLSDQIDQDFDIVQTTPVSRVVSEEKEAEKKQPLEPLHPGLFADLENLGNLKQIEADMLVVEHSMPLLRRISNQVETVNQESIQESTAKLNLVNMYSWPGGQPAEAAIFIKNNVIPLNKNIGERLPTAILSNRRFIRVYQSLLEMPEAEAEALINAELPKAMEEYIKLYNGYSEFKKKQEEDAIGWVSETTDENEVVLLGSRYKVLGLVWIAGLLEIKGCEDNVNKAINIAIKQRDEMYHNSKYSDTF